MKRRIFVVRLWLDQESEFHGQIRDPFSEIRRPFLGKEGMWQQLMMLVNENESIRPEQNDSPQRTED